MLLKRLFNVSTVTLFRTTPTQTITFHLRLKWLLGSNINCKWNNFKFGSYCTFSTQSACFYFLRGFSINGWFVKHLETFVPLQNNPSRCRQVIYILVQQPDGHQKICTFCLSPKPGDSPSNCKRYVTLLFIVARCNLYLYVLIPNKRQILLFFF